MMILKLWPRNTFPFLHVFLGDKYLVFSLYLYNHCTPYLFLCSPFISVHVYSLPSNVEGSPFIIYCLPYHRKRKRENILREILSARKNFDSYLAALKYSIKKKRFCLLVSYCSFQRIMTHTVIAHSLCFLNVLVFISI